MAYTNLLTLETYDHTISNPIAVESFSFNIEQSLNIGLQRTGAGVGPGRVTLDPFSITRFTDLMSPHLIVQCSSGTAFKIVTLTVTPRGANRPVVTYRLGLVAIKTISTGGSQHSGPLPTETVTFEYGSLQVEFYDIALNQTTIGNWDQVHNVKGFDTGA